MCCEVDEWLQNELAMRFHVTWQCVNCELKFFTGERQYRLQHNSNVEGQKENKKKSTKRSEGQKERKDVVVFKIYNMYTVVHFKRALTFLGLLGQLTLGQTA